MLAVTIQHSKSAGNRFERWGLMHSVLASRIDFAVPCPINDYKRLRECRKKLSIPQAMMFNFRRLAANELSENSIFLPHESGLAGVLEGRMMLYG